MSAQVFEQTLASLYTDATFRNAFLQDASQAIMELKLTASEKQSLLNMDRAGLVMAAQSFDRKRSKRSCKRSFFQRVRASAQSLWTQLRRHFP